MVQINFALKEVNCKVVYYGAGLSGKTTNLEVVHSKAPQNHCGELTSIATEGDRTLFFDFLPLNLGEVAGMTTKFQIYTVPGQVYYNSTRKLVLQGADGIVFVADSRKGKMDENIESLANLEENLREYGMDINTIPLVLQYNKRDLDDIYSVEEMDQKLNRFNCPTFEAVAVTGEGVFPTLKKLSSMVLESLNRQQGSTVVKGPKKKKAQAAAQAGKQKAGAGAGGGSATAVAKKPRPKAGAPRAKRAAQPRTGKKGGNKVVRERVVNSQGVKSIERKSPSAAGARAGKGAGGQAKGVQKNGAQKQTARVASGDQVPAKKKSFALVWVVIVALLGAAGAALYFSGMLDKFIK